jgi:hypothetical protein
MRTQSPIKVQESPFLVQQENVLKRETPSKFRDRQSPNFVQRDNDRNLECDAQAILFDRPNNEQIFRLL